MSSEQSPAESLVQGSVIAGKYRVERRLGQGGMGSVFLVQHVHTDERLALKLLHATVVKDASALDRFRREARTPARIDSDHVVRVTDADVAPELGGVPFFVMEHLRGEDLDQASRRRGPLPPDEVVMLLSQAARALDKAHALGIVHRDLKPENLFLTQRDDGSSVLKILDFGIAKVTTGEVQDAGRLTATGQIFGTPLYMSPEQALAESEKICPQTDVWAMGLIAHRLLHGKEYWTAQTLTHLVAQIAFEPLQPPSALGSALGPAYDDWFAVCCARDIGSRFKSAGEAISMLAAAVGVTDSPSQLRKLAMNVRVPVKGGVTDERDELAATRASETPGPTAAAAAAAVTVPRPASLGRTQFGAEAPRQGGVPRTLGYAAAAVAAMVIGAAAAWKYTGPDEDGRGAATAAPFVTAAPSEAAHTAAAKPDVAPVVTEPVVTPSANVTAAPSVTPADPSTRTPASTGGSGGKTAQAPATKPTARAAAAPSATAEPAPTPAKTVDPLGSRR